MRAAAPAGSRRVWQCSQDGRSSSTAGHYLCAADRIDRFRLTNASPGIRHVAFGYASAPESYVTSGWGRHWDGTHRVDDVAKLNIGLKALLVGLLVLGATHQGWSRFAGKGFSYRLVLFTLPTLIVPLVWLLRSRRGPYPHLPDLLIVMPFLLDTLGNALNFYNRFDRTDDVLHFSNWIPLVAGLTLLLRRTATPPLVAFACGIGFGAAAILWWEEAEFLIMKSGSVGLHLTYQDTMGDLALSFAGGVVGATVASALANRNRRPHGSLPHDADM